MKPIGYLFFGIGVVLIFVVIFLGFSLYAEVTQNASSIASLPQTQDVMAQLNKLLNNVNIYIPLGVYLTVKVLLLFVLLEAGFKLSQIGLSIVKEKK